MKVVVFSLGDNGKGIEITHNRGQTAHKEIYAKSLQTMLLKIMKTGNNLLAEAHPAKEEKLTKRKRNNSQKIIA